ncbi:MAG: L-aspartate oxidase [Anaerolineae bacterium]|nr:L-aspartate oxidase [Anaerolineae bacterium]
MTDVLIIGSGIAGGSAALRLAEMGGAKVTIVSAASDPREANTYYAQGGIIGRGPADSAGLLAEDLYRAGAGINNPEAVELLIHEGPRLVEQFLHQKLGVPFDTGPDNGLEYLREAAHSTERILHVEDSTGRAIEEKLVDALSSQPNITLLSEHTAVDLLTLSHHSLNPLHAYQPLTCVGAYVFDQRRGEIITILAKKTILATGGVGQIYLHTTNPPIARGDGVAMAARAGARILHAQFIQFHPTAFYYQGKAQFLVSETVRGAGARLVNQKGEAFMERYAPEWKDLAPRDVVARSIHYEMLATGASHVYLDLRSHLSADQIRARFPYIYENALQYGVDITQELIPVVPAAHYFIGGVWVDSEGRSSIRNLYAAGEVSCTGVHGANRLGSASLLEGLVWGHRAAEDALRSLDGLPVQPEDIPPWEDPGLVERVDPALIAQDLTTIKYIMWNYVGLVRSQRRLERAMDDLTQLRSEISRFYRRARLSDSLIGLRNSVETAILVASAAWEDRRSVGAHYRED